MSGLKPSMTGARTLADYADKLIRQLESAGLFV